VSERLNLVLKLTSMVMLVGGAIVLWAAPLLFHLAFEGRYDEGLAVLPWTLTYCAWYSLLLVAQNYIWCAEKTRLSTIPLSAGLATNFALNVVLIPAWGLEGAVISTTAATGLATAVLYWINHRSGMKLQTGMILLTIAPAALCGGAWCGTAMLLLLVAVLPFSKTLITSQERKSLAELVQSYVAKLAMYWSGGVRKPEPSRVL
jgi:O-antigen/teichoic acid export membrane protein